MSQTETMVVCGECHRENEPERVYCHDCGARLDRTAVLTRQEDPSKVEKRVKKMFNPRRGKLRALFFKVSKIVLAACAAATVILTFLPPEVPAPPKAGMLASEMRFEMEKATGRHQAVSIQYSQDQVNDFLIYALKNKQAALNKPLIDFKRACVRFGEGSCTITTERSVFGYSIYTTVKYAVTLSEGKFNGVATGGGIGRLPIHPQAAQFMSPLYGDVWHALEQEIKLVRKFNSLAFHEKSVVLTSQ